MKKLLFILVAVLSAVANASAYDKAEITLEAAQVEAGSKVFMSANSSNVFAGVQFRVVTPDGITCTRVLRGSTIMAENDEEEKVFVTSFKNNMFIAYSSAGELSTSAGQVARIELSVDADLAAGDYEIKLQEVETSIASETINDITETSKTLTVTRTATGIKALAGEATAKGVYDLRGRKIEANPAKGVYIVDGRKVVVK